MIIRDMNYSDIESIRIIAAQTWKDTYSSFIPEEIQDKTLKDAYSMETMDRRFKESITLVAESNDKILGYAFFSSNLDNKEIFLESLYVHPKHQGKGIGKELYLKGINKFEQPEAISLTVYKGNRNISFYEKQGFNIVKEIQGDFNGHSVIFIFMKKEFAY